MDKDTKNNKGNKYEYKVNMNVLVGTLKENLIMIINSDSKKIDEKIEWLYNQIKRNLVVIKPDRKNSKNETRTSNKHRINRCHSF